MTTPADAPVRHPLLWYALGVLGLAVAYFLGARFAVTFVADADNVAYIWPPTGIAVAVLFRAGARYWPGVFLGALACELQLFPWWVALGIAGGNTAGPVVAVALLRGLAPSPLGSGRRALYCYLLSGAVGMTITATNALVWRAAGDAPLPGLTASWLTWWLGDTAGFLIFGPPLLTATWPQRSRATARRAALLGLTAGLSVLGFSNLIPTPVRSLFVFPPFMLLIWIGMTQRLGVGSVHVLVMATCAALGTAQGTAFAHSPPMAKLLMLWALTTTAALVVLATTAALAERDRAEAALSASAAEFQALVDSTPAAIVRYSAGGTLTFANETFAKVLGLSRAELVGRPIQLFIPNMPCAEAVADLPVAQPMTGPAAGVSGVIRKPDGSHRWYRWTAKLITTPAGTTEFQAVGLDLTERRLADEERAALEKKMQDTQRLEALGVLAGGVAHDFNNLLAGVMGHAELAAAALPDGHPAREHLDTVLSGVIQAGGLTRQLLAYSGKGRFLLRALDLNDLINQTTELLRLTLPKKVQLNLELAPHLPPVTGDDGQLRQVLMNLIINAGEAIGDRAGTVTVTTSGHALEMDAVSGGVYSPAAPGRFVELVVSDTGCGMDEATKAKLFDPFFTTKFAGRGLGLSAVLGIIKGHGGGVRVDSRTGFGTRFTVLLPAGSGPPSVAAKTPAPFPGLLGDGRRTPRPAEATPAPRAADAPRGLALVADDEPIVRDVGEMMLRQLGFDVLTADNGAEAVAQFAANADRVRLVLLDLMMPEMDGIEALAQIRARSTVPVVLCSGYAAEAVPEDLSVAPNVSFLQKPYSRAALQEMLSSVGV